MATEIKMPKLGLTMTEGLIVEWKKNEGDEVTSGEILFILETEKVQFEVESPGDGILGRIDVPADSTVLVGTVVGYLLGKGESTDSLPAPSADAPGA